MSGTRDHLAARPWLTVSSQSTYAQEHADRALREVEDARRRVHDDEPVADIA